jgi:hypothetical protein
MGRGGTPSL